ncbi:MAG: efflux RND transporter periplasmic adaptor subunit [Acidobacteriota bacterium]
MLSKPLTPRKKAYGFLLVVVLLAGGGYLVKHYLAAQAAARAAGNGNENKKPDGKESSPVELAQATRDRISAYLTSTANLRALREVDIASQTEGVVEAVLAEEGDFVKEGQVLCRLDDTQLQIRLELARERLAQAKFQQEKARKRQEKAISQIENTRKEVARLQRAFDEQLISERELAQAQYRLDELEHDERVSSSETREFNHRVDELEAEIKQAELEISRTQVRAPFAGMVTQRTVELGRTIRNLDALFKLGTFSPLLADVHLSEREAHQVKPEQTAIVKLGVDESVQCRAKVARISPVVDQASGTVKVTLELNPTQAALKPGAFVRVDIQTDTRPDAVLIPKRAVLEEDGEHFVFIISGDTAHRTKVTLGYEWAGQVEVRNGVAAGQQVVVAGQGALKDGGKIRIVQG